LMPIRLSQSEIVQNHTLSRTFIHVLFTPLLGSI
jgi:hypothetical protein